MCLHVYQQAEWRPTLQIFNMPWLFPPLVRVFCSGPCDGIVATKKGPALLNVLLWHRWPFQLCFNDNLAKTPVCHVYADISCEDLCDRCLDKEGKIFRNTKRPHHPPFFWLPFSMNAGRALKERAIPWADCTKLMGVKGISGSLGTLYLRVKLGATELSRNLVCC